MSSSGAASGRSLPEGYGGLGGLGGFRPAPTIATLPTTNNNYNQVQDIIPASGSSSYTSFSLPSAFGVPPSISSPSVLPVTSNPVAAIPDELISKLRFAEEQLQNERRSRGWIEAELQSSKTQISALTAKVERLQDLFNEEASTVRDLSRKEEAVDRRVAQLAQEMSIKVDKSQMKTQMMLSDLIARQRAADQFREDESERHRNMTEEINALRYRLETFSLQSTEVGQEFRSRVRDFESELQRGTETLRAIKDHDHALETLHHTIDSSSDAISKKVDMSIIDLRQKIDSEARGRFQFENGMRELYSEVRKVIASQDRDLTHKIESASQQAVTVFERERLERERSSTSLLEQMRNLEKMVRDNIQNALDKVAGQLNSIEDTVSQERMGRSKFESSIRAELEDGFKLMQMAVAKKVDEMQQVQNETRHSVGVAVKTLKEAVVLVERTSDQKLSAVEDVLRAEIRSRLETDRTLADMRAEMETKAEIFEQKALDAISEVTEEARSSHAKIEEDLKKTAEQMIISKTRAIDDIETQVAQIRKRVKESETEITAKLHQIQLAGEQIGRDAQTSLENAESRIESRFQIAAGNIIDMGTKVRDVATLCEKTKAEMEDKLNFRVVQIDSTMEAFKQELELRITKKDASDSEKRFEASVAGVQSTIGHVNISLQNLQDVVDKSASKKELEDVESRTKAQFATISNRVSEVDGALITVREELGTKMSKKDLETVESNIKESILNLQLKQMSSEETSERIQEDLKERITKKHLGESEERVKSQLLDLEARTIDFDMNIKSLKDALNLRATHLDIAEAETKLQKEIHSIYDRIGEVSVSVTEAKSEISQTVRDDVEEMVSKINGALDAVQARADVTDGAIETMKMRISDSEANARARLQQANATLESMIADQVVAVGNVREITAQQIKDLSERIIDIPRQLKAAQVQQDEFKKKLTETVKADADRLAHWVTDMKEKLTEKVSENEFDRLQTETHAALQKVGSQLDVDSLAIEQSRTRLTELESSIREKHRELQSSQEHALSEQAQTMRGWRESAIKRVEDVESRVAAIPKTLEQAWSEIKKLRFDVDERMRSELTKIEKTIGSLKGEITTKISAKSLDSSLATTISPLSGRIERIHTEIEDIRSNISRLQQQTTMNTTSYSIPPPGAISYAHSTQPQNYNSNFYKPPPLEFTRAEVNFQPDQLPPIPSASTIASMNNNNIRASLAINPRKKQQTDPSSPPTRGGESNYIIESSNRKGSPSLIIPPQKLALSSSRTSSLNDISSAMTGRNTPPARMLATGSDPQLERIADMMVDDETGGERTENESIA